MCVLVHNKEERLLSVATKTVYTFSMAIHSQAECISNICVSVCVCVFCMSRLWACHWAAHPDHCHFIIEA